MTTPQTSSPGSETVSSEPSSASTDGGKLAGNNTPHLSPQACNYHRTYLLTFQCSACKVRFRIGRVLRPHPVGPGAFKFCALCGAETVGVIQNDEEETYWESLAMGFDLPVDLIKLLYEDWSPDEHHRFSDYVKEMMAEGE